MIEVIATAESVNQAKALLTVGIDTLYVGQDQFGLRLPKSLTLDEIEEIVQEAHKFQKRLIVAVNGLMHNHHIDDVPDYLSKLDQIGVDAITVGDPGVIMTLQELNLSLPFIYDAQTMVTSADHISFWVKRGAIGAVAARELTLIELENIQNNISVPLEVQVYGPTCIHQSKRPLVSNYFRYSQKNEATNRERGLFLSEPKDPETQYPIYEDQNGTHIYSTEDLSLMPYLDRCVQKGITTWKLDGVLLQGDRFVRIAQLFVSAKQAIESGAYSSATFETKLHELQPTNRPLGAGFYLKQPGDVQ